MEDQIDTNKIKNKRKGKFKTIFNITFVLVFSIGSLLFTFFRNDTSKIISIFSSMNIGFIFVIISLVISFIFVRSLILFCFARLFKRKYYLNQAIAVEEIGDFYKSITPGKSGEQVMEAITYTKQGLNVASSVSIVAMYAIIFTFVNFVYCLVSFIVKYNFINDFGIITFTIGILKIELPIWLITVLGFLMSFFEISIILLMSFSKKFHRFIIGPVLDFLEMIHIVKNKEKRREKLRISVENFKIEMNHLFTNIPFLILASLLFFAYFTIKNSVPYFAGLALHNQSTNASFWDSVLLSNYHQMVVGIIPLPGGAGISEFFFSMLFCGQKDGIMGFYAILDASGIPNYSLSSSLTSAALLLWRSLTFLLPLLFSSFVVLFYRSSPKEVIHEHGEYPNRETFVTLQKSTLAERINELNQLSGSTSFSKSNSKNKKNDKNSSFNKNNETLNKNEDTRNEASKKEGDS